MKSYKNFILGVFTLIIWHLPYVLEAQYFGRNKPRYDQMKFKILNTPTFDIYHYIERPQALELFATWAEQWQHQHSAILHSQLSPPNPLLLYNDHADFQQTNAISGNIGVGTGGVTEAFKNRVILPFSFAHEQTHHVLGHEMVHAFQYHLVINGDSTSLQNLQNLPLWMVEGMAEYMSKGSRDPFTAMWMRDAVIQDDVPTIRKLYDPNYFPYRFGQAFWAWITSVYGDQIIEPLFMNTAKYGIDFAFARMFGKSEKEMGEDFVKAIHKYYEPYVKGKKDDVLGKILITDKNAGFVNVSPSVSPDGKYITFLSEKDLFSTDLYLAKTTDGKIIRKVASSTKGGSIEEFNFLESSGTWSPDSKQFAFVVVANGRNELVIKNVENGKTVYSSPMEGVPAISCPAWSPDGKTIVFSGLVQGQTDLFLLDVKSKKVTQLTNDVYSELQPSWSFDSQTIVFSTDQATFNGFQRKGPWTMDLAILNINTRQSNVLDIFHGANNLNPQFDNEGTIYFLSDRDGFRNIYKYIPSSGELFQMTKFLTGVSGITDWSPALSVSYKRDRMAYSVFRDKKYVIYSVRPDQTEAQLVRSDDIQMDAGTLPHAIDAKLSVIDQSIDHPRLSHAVSIDSVSIPNYRPKIKLDYIGGSTGIGIGTNAGFGNSRGFAGGIDMIFSDFLGDHQIYSTLSMNGQIYDFGGQVFYLNSKRRIPWGIGVSHRPAYYGVSYEPIYAEVIDGQGNRIPSLLYSTDLVRRFEEGIQTLAQWPFNVTHRAEAAFSYSRYHFRSSTIKEYYFYDPSNPNNPNNGAFLTSEEVKSEYQSPGFNLFDIGVAFVGDNSYWGVASPLNGFRYRIGADQYFGAFQFRSTLIDGRYYKFLNKVGMAFRLYNQSRFNQNSASRQLQPLYSVDPTIVRGFLSYSDAEWRAMGLTYENLSGSKLSAFNAEIRLPFTGPERLSLIKSKRILTELAWFFDAGVAYDNLDDIEQNPGNGIRSKLIMSTGASLRINLFGSLILEPYYAKALHQNGKWRFGINFVPGW